MTRQPRQVFGAGLALPLPILQHSMFSACAIEIALLR